MTYTDGITRYEVERKSNVALPDDNDLVETIYCEGNNLLVIRKKPREHYSDTLTQCSDANALVSALTRSTDNDIKDDTSVNDNNTALADDTPHYSLTTTSDKPKAAKSDPHYSGSVASGKSETAITTKPKSTTHTKEVHTPPSEDDNVIDLTNPNITAVEGELVDTSTGKIIGKCKRADSLTRAWDMQRWKLYNVPFEQSCFISATVDNYPTYSTMNKLSTDYSLWLKASYPDVGGCLFLEPREDGSWHSHFIPYFPHGVPADLENKTKAWWAQFNTKDCDEQVKVELFEDEEHLKNTVDYKLYMELYERGVELVFLKEPHLNTAMYRDKINNQINLNLEQSSDDSGEYQGKATDNFLKALADALNKLMRELIEDSIALALDRAQKEREYLVQRTKEGLDDARDNKGKTLGRPKGKKTTEATQKELAAKKVIKEHSPSFGGKLLEKECITLSGVSKRTYYKYRAELLSAKTNGSN